MLQRFTVRFLYNPIRGKRGILRLTGFYVYPFYRNTDVYAGPWSRCGCLGRGQFADQRYGSIAPFAHRFHYSPHQLGVPPQFVDHTFSTVVHGKFFMTRHTKFIVAVIGREIGRFGVFGVNVKRKKLVPLENGSKNGCIPAYWAWYVSPKEIQKFLATQVNRLPTVPCSQAIPSGNRVAVATPFELSSSRPVNGLISGYATSAQWLIAFRSPRTRSE